MSTESDAWTKRRGRGDIRVVAPTRAHHREVQRSELPSAHSQLSLEKQYTIFPINGAGPEVGATHRECSVRRVDDYVLLVHLVDFATGEAERSLGRISTLAFPRIENVTINHDVGLLAKR